MTKRRFYPGRKLRVPMNIQFFADGDSGDEGNTGGSEDGKPSYEDLVKELAQEKANNARLKAASDKQSADISKYKNQIKDLMTEEQRKAAEKKEQEENTAQELDDLRKELGQMKAIAKYRALGMDEDLAKETAEAEINGDMDKVTECYQKHIKAVQANEYQKFLEGRNDPHSGRGDEKNSVAEDFAKQAAHARKNADTDILKNYMIGGR